MPAYFTGIFHGTNCSLARNLVIPAQAGIQLFKKSPRSGSISRFWPLCGVHNPLDFRLRGNDVANGLSGLKSCQGQLLGMPNNSALSRAKSGAGWKQTAPALVIILSFPLARRIPAWRCFRDCCIEAAGVLSFFFSIAAICCSVFTASSRAMPLADSINRCIFIFEGEALAGFAVDCMANGTACVCAGCSIFLLGTSGKIRGCSETTG